MSLLSLAMRPLLPVDETRYASVAWEMWHTGNWFVPHLNGGAYDHKPPLLFWLIHIGWALFGVSEWWPRVVAPLCTLLAVLALDRLAIRLWPDRPAAGRIGSLIFLSSFYIAVSLTAVMFDMLLLACVSWGWVALHRAAISRDWIGWLGFGLATGLGILAKGPVALVYLLPPLLLARWWMPEQRQRSHWYMPTVAMALAAAVPLAWLLAASGNGSPDYIAKLVFDQTVNRVNGQMGHPRPWYWYLPLLLAISLPWSVWPPAWRSLQHVRALCADRASRFAVLTLAAAFLILCLISGKQVHYLIPVLAMGALVIGRCLCEPQEVRPATNALPAALLMGSAGVLMTFLAILGPLQLPNWMHGLPWWATLISVAISLGLLTSRARTVCGEINALALASFSFCAVTIAGVFSVISPRYDLSNAAQYIARQQSLGREVAYVGKYQGEFTFLGRLHHPLVQLTVKEAGPWINTHPSALVVSRLKRVANKDHLAIEYAQPYKMDYLLMYRQKHVATSVNELTEVASLE